MTFPQTKGTSSQVKRPSEYKNSATGLIMQTGNFLVNYHGFCLFVTKRYTYLPWVKTKECGMLPPTQEYGRLQKMCVKFTLTSEQENTVWAIVQQLLKSPYYGLSRMETFAAKAGKVKKERFKKQQESALKSCAIQKQKAAKPTVLRSFAELRKTG